MIMVIDVGNLNIALGVYDGYKLISSWKLATNPQLASDEIGTLIYKFFEFDEIDPKKLEQIIISSVVPNIMYSLTHGLRKYFGINPMIVKHGMNTEIKINMDNPKELGANRIVNLTSAYHFYGKSCPVMVIDYSTATTFDVIDEKGVFITGITAPGINICAEALYSRAAQLPKIEIKRPESVYCRNMVECIQAGIYYSHLGGTRYIINRIKKELGARNLKVIATGGMARVIAEKNSIFNVCDPYLSFKGLRLIYEMNYHDAYLWEDE
ncbi:MAG: type III pantothenate kinase [Clostridia bacterium]|jgi:type III pantothenate kinase|nr:type III pantothenate kinase [Clostridia bacterium]MCI2001082.1 type III pantothenate kinase [Clostridia bacterium]MCI2015792.1 type III pantothenate kinase [Clostridia bacterium]